MDFVTNSIYDAGLFGGLYTKKPARSRWGTMTAACAANSGAKLIHGLCSRVLLCTWPDAKKPIPIGTASDYHFQIKSKLHRVVKKLGDAMHDLKHVSVSFCASPLDHLLQQIQRPSKKGILVDMLHNDTNPFLQCQLDMGEMVLAPVADTAIGPILWYFSENGLAPDVISQTLLGYVLAFSSELFLFIENDLASKPFTIAKWFDEGITAGEQLELIRAFVNDKDCCDDRGISRKV